MITIPVNNRGRTVIGRLGENEHRCIAFRDSAAVLQMYPSAAVTVLHQRPGDPAAYPVGSQYVTVDGGAVKWMVQSGDLSTAGCGQCELIFTQGGIVAKTMIYETEILPALDGAGEPPEPWESWVQEVTDAAEAAQGYAEQAQEAAESLIPATAAETKAYLDIS